MRTLLALLSAFILVVTTMQADAVKEKYEQRMKAKRSLLSETSFGRKANAGGTEAKNLPNKNSATANTNNNQGTANKNDANGGGDDDHDDTNDSYQNYGNNSGSSTGSHHYFVDVRRPPING